MLLSRGAAGVSWYGPDIALQAVPPTVEVVSTVGAGDSLLAATLHGLLSGWPAERTLRLATAIAGLPAEQAEMLRLAYFEDRSHSDIAEALALPLGTVKSRLRLAIGRLRALFEPEETQ